MSKIHLWKEDPVESQGHVTLSVTLESSGRERRSLWYKVPARFAGGLSDTFNPFVVGTIFTAMRESSDLVIHGNVSRVLLENLEEFQAVWASWTPEKYSRIEMIADTEIDDSGRKKANDALASFSGGVDGAFTVYRHHKQLCGRLNRDIKAGVFIHGLDIPLEREDIFDKAAEKAEIMLKSLDMDIVAMSTNYRQLGENFGDSHGAAVASSLLVLENFCSTGFIASTEPYIDMTFPWGSNPLTDRLFSSDRFEIVHDGAAYTRSGKINVISDWDEALKYLRVCWQSDNLDQNCCRCEKCIRTILNMRVLGIGLPECFEHDVSDRMISKMKGLNVVAISFLDEILSRAKEHSMTESWVYALEKTVRKNRRAQVGWRRKLHEIRNRWSIRTKMNEIFSRNHQ